MGLPGDGGCLNLTLGPACQVERVITIMQNPRQYKIPDWFLNRQKDGEGRKIQPGVCVERGAERKAGSRLGLALETRVENSHPSLSSSGLQVLANGLDNKLREDLELPEEDSGSQGLRAHLG